MTLFNNNICDLLLFNNNIHLSDSVLFVLYASTFVSLFEFQYLLVMVMLYDHLSRSLYVAQFTIPILSLSHSLELTLQPLILILSYTNTVSY